MPAGHVADKSQTGQRWFRLRTWYAGRELVARISCRVSYRGTLTNKGWGRMSQAPVTSSAPQTIPTIAVSMKLGGGLAMRLSQGAANVALIVTPRDT